MKDTVVKRGTKTGTVNEEGVVKGENGIANMSYSIFYKVANPRDLTYDMAVEILDSVMGMNSSQLSKAVYYGLEIIHQILKRMIGFGGGSIKFRDVCMNRIRDHSISWGTQQLEMIADFNQHGQTNGVLKYYFDKCWNEDLEPVPKAQADFINIALVHSYITGCHNWLAAMFVDMEQDSGNERRLAKLKDLIFELSQYRPEVWDAINVERNASKAADYLKVHEIFIPNPVTIDDSSRIPQELDNGEYIKFVQDGGSSQASGSLALPSI